MGESCISDLTKKKEGRCWGVTFHIMGSSMAQDKYLHTDSHCNNRLEHFIAPTTPLESILYVIQ